MIPNECRFHLILQRVIIFLSSRFKSSASLPYYALYFSCENIISATWGKSALCTQSFCTTKAVLRHIAFPSKIHFTNYCYTTPLITPA